jgi:cell division protein FtsB
MEEQNSYTQSYDYASALRDLEQKQRLLKDKTILIGKNLIEDREKLNEELTSIKKDLQILKDTVERLSSFIKTLSGELSNFARKQDIEILTKQAKMFQPLEFIKRNELNDLIKKN